MSRSFFARCVVVVGALLALHALQASATVQTKGSAGVDSWGQSTYSVPVAIPPGTAGMEPKLVLTYSSRAGDGPFGLGWSLSGLSSITRCPGVLATEGWVGGVRLDAFDKFCLDGQKLVAINGGAYGAEGTEYRTEAETFTKVVSHGASGSGPTSFNVWTQDGLIMEYGVAANARFPTTPNASVREWALNRVSDRSGNYYTITYSVNTATNEVVPVQIDYTGNASAGTAPYASVRINYEVRPDPETYLVGPSSVGRALRATSIDTLVDGALVTHYILAYETGETSARSRLRAIAQCSPSGACLEAVTFQFQAGGGGVTQPGASSVNLGYPGSFRSTSIVQLMKGDFNGDGIEDLVVIDNLGQGRICYGPSFAAASCGIPFGVGENFTVMDYNGDGISDFAFLSGGQLRFCPGPSPEPLNQQCFVVPNQSYPGYKFVSGDFNGDGKDDLFLWHPTNGEPYGFFCDDIPQNINGRFCNGRAKNATGFKVFTGDFDGDGMADLLLVGASDYWVCTGYKTFVGANGSAACSHVLTGDLTTSSVLVGDFNGDSKQDMLLVTPNDIQLCAGPAFITSNTCTHVPGTGGGGAPSIAQVVAGDFDGDGASDIFFARPEGGFFGSGRSYLRNGVWNYNMAGQDWRFVPIIAGNFQGRGTQDLIAGGSTLLFLSGGTQMPDLLSTATDGAFGTVTSFTYLPLTDPGVYTKGTGSVWPLQDIRRPWYVTSQMIAPTGVWNVRNTHTYRYEKGHVSLEGRGGSLAAFNRNFIGFELVHDTDTAAGRETVSSWVLGFPHFGRVQELTTYVGGQVAYKKTRQLDSMVTFENRIRSILRTEWVTSFGLDGDWTNTRYDYNYDLYGNPPTVSTYFNSLGVQYTDAKKIVNVAYTNDVASWLFGVPYVKQETYRLPDGTQYIWKETYTAVPGTRLIQQKVHEPEVPELKVTTNYSYNAFGLPTLESVIGNGYAARNTTRTYDTRGRFVTSEVNPLNQTTSFTNDTRFGAFTSRTDPNNITMSWQYDDLGRKRVETRPDGTQKTWDPVNCPACRGYVTNPNIASYVYVQETGRPVRYEYYDEFDRYIMVSRPTLNGGNWIDEDNVWFDANGKVARKHGSYTRGDAVIPYTQKSYDTYGRLPTETASNNATTTYSYSAAPNAGPITTSVRNPRNFTTQFVRDTWGQLLQVIDAKNGSTTYAYDPLGKPSRITDANGNVTTMAYNKVGWLAVKADPDLGTWTYAYDPFGNKIQQIDAKGQTTTYSYDALNRKYFQTEPSQTGTWQWDSTAYGIGKLATYYTNAGVQVSYAYIPTGRLGTRYTIVDGVAYPISYAYDAVGRLATIGYPNGFGVTYVYNNSVNYLSEIRNTATNALIWRVAAADAYGPTDMDLGNGTGFTVSYDPHLHRPTTSVVTRDSDSALLQGLTYGYDLIGNTTSRADSTTGLSESFGYDELDRITSVAGPAAKTYEYDLIGNITNKTDVAPYMPGGSYLYQSGKPHAVSSVQGVFSFGYDGNGNMTAGAGRTVTLNSFNLPTSVQKGATVFTWAYDANYSRGKLTTPADTKIYVRDESGRPMYERTISPGTGLQTFRSMIYAKGVLVAQDTQRSNGQNDFRYFYNDGLDSISLVLNEAGQIVERLSYDAFGKRRFPNGQDDPGNTLVGATTSYAFTGHEYLDGLALVHMNGRLYDPFLARFISADGRDGEQATPQDFNRYAYVLNSPFTYSDPTGFGPNGRGGHIAFQNWGQGDLGLNDRSPRGNNGDGSDPDAMFLWRDGRGNLHYGADGRYNPIDNSDNFDASQTTTYIPTSPDGQNLRIDVNGSRNYWDDPRPPMQFGPSNPGTFWISNMLPRERQSIIRPWAPNPLQRFVCAIPPGAAIAGPMAAGGLGVGTAGAIAGNALIRAETGHIIRVGLTGLLPIFWADGVSSGFFAGGIVGAGVGAAAGTVAAIGVYLYCRTLPGG